MKSKTNQIKPVIAGPMGVRADAALYFVDQQFLFHGIDEGGSEQVKFISSASVREAFAKEPIDSGWLPAGVLRCGTSTKGDWMVKWCEPRVYTLHLDGRATALKVPMPSLIWFGIGRHYYIFASKLAGFSQRAALFHAPLANINNHGLICFGDNAHPDVKTGFERAWQSFWLAPFNDHHDDGKSKAHPKAVNEMLTKLNRAKVKKYPLDDLVSMNITLDQAVSRLTRRGNEWD